MSEHNLITRDLTEEERISLCDAIAFFFSVIEAEGLAPEAEPDTCQVCDELVRWWHAAPEDDRPDEHTLVSMLGAVVGDLLRHAAWFDWKYVRDGEDEYLALVGGDEAPVVVAIFDAMSKRLQDNPDGFVSDFFEGLFEHVGHLARAEDDPLPAPLFSPE